MKKAISESRTRDMNIRSQRSLRVGSKHCEHSVEHQEPDADYESTMAPLTCRGLDGQASRAERRSHRMEAIVKRQRGATLVGRSQVRAFTVSKIPLRQALLTIATVLDLFE